MSQIVFSIPNEVLYDTKMNDSETVDFPEKLLHYGIIQRKACHWSIAPKLRE